MPDRLGDILALLKRIADAVEAPPAEALDAKAAATLCGVSRSKWHSMNSSGQCPRSIDVAGCPRWSRTELISWLQSGAPSRSTWIQIRASALRRAG